MTKLMPVFILTLLFSVFARAQGQYEVFSERPGEKTLKGIISKEILISDTSFKWYAESLNGYTPNTKALEGLKKNTDSLQFIVFMGTWCEDSHFVVPKFYSLTETAGFSKDRITLIGVDRNKKTLSHLAEALNIINVPTIIVLKNGKEMGRVIEFGKYGLFDMELGEILSNIN